ncbi:MAG TPA: PQQ-binding-like beta-propeller repeat protein [Pyrinomonadaceae bacterium]|nr:PQQ-binding-like beta-propeller repeat protein [Pyrinomonadaceae bacterium]
MKRVFLTSLLLLVLSGASVAQNWPQFRGVNASGVATGAQKTPVSWNAAKSENVLWRTAIPGLSHASPVVWGDKVFVITAVSADTAARFNAKDKGIGLARDDVKHTWRIYSLDKNTGRIHWERTAYEGVPRSKRHVKATQANSTPATDGKTIVALMGSEGLYAYDFAGKLLWKQDLGVLNPGLAGDPTSEWGHASSPVIYRHLVIVQCDKHQGSFIAAYNLRDGKQAWRVERDELPSWSPPAIYEGKARAELVANASNYVRGYDPLTGKELWRFANGGQQSQVQMPAPVFANDLIIVTGGYPGNRPVKAFRAGATGDISLKEGEESNASLAYRLARGSSYTGTPLVYGDLMYISGDNGVLRVFEAKTGKAVYEQRLPATFSASPVAADGKIYLASEDGDVYVVRAGATYELLATNPMGEPLMATPAISGGLLIMRSQSYVYAIGEAKKKV